MIRMKDRLEVAWLASGGLFAAGVALGAEGLVGSNQDTLDYSYLQAALDLDYITILLTIYALAAKLRRPPGGMRDYESLTS
jgi:hypothetical protein